MFLKSITQIENEVLDIHDKDRTTEGGPPSWIVMLLTGVLFFIVAAAFVILYLYFVSFPS